MIRLLALALFFYSCVAAPEVQVELKKFTLVKIRTLASGGHILSWKDENGLVVSQFIKHKPPPVGTIGSYFFRR